MPRALRKGWPAKVTVQGHLVVTKVRARMVWAISRKASASDAKSVQKMAGRVCSQKDAEGQVDKTQVATRVMRAVEVQKKVETCSAKTGNTDKSHGDRTGTGSVVNDEEEDVVQG
jgi:hypothetical protein